MDRFAHLPPTIACQPAPVGKVPPAQHSCVRGSGIFVASAGTGAGRMPLIPQVQGQFLHMPLWEKKYGKHL